MYDAGRAWIVYIFHLETLGAPHPDLSLASICLGCCTYQEPSLSPGCPSVSSCCHDLEKRKGKLPYTISSFQSRFPGLYPEMKFSSVSAIRTHGLAWHGFLMGAAFRSKLRDKTVKKNQESFCTLVVLDVMTLPPSVLAALKFCGFSDSGQRRVAFTDMSSLAAFNFGGGDGT